MKKLLFVIVSFSMLTLIMNGCKFSSDYDDISNYMAASVVSGGGVDGSSVDSNTQETNTQEDNTQEDNTQEDNAQETQKNHTVTNLRYATRKDWLEDKDKDKQNKVLQKGADLYVAVDTDVSEVTTIKFAIFRNGEPEWWYMDLSKYAGKLSDSSIWLTYPNGPTNFIGDLKLEINVSFKNGQTVRIEKDNIQVKAELSKEDVFSDGAVNSAYEYRPDLNSNLKVSYSQTIDNYTYYGVKVGTVYNIPIGTDLNNGSVRYGGQGQYTITTSVANATTSSVAKQQSSTVSRVVYDSNFKTFAIGFNVSIPNLFGVGFNHTTDTYSNYTTTGSSSSVTTTEGVTQTTTNTYSVTLNPSYPKGYYKVCREADFDLYVIVGVPNSIPRNSLTMNSPGIVLTSKSVMGSGVTISCLYSADQDFETAEANKEYPITKSDYERVIQAIRNSPAVTNVRYGNSLDSVRVVSPDLWNKDTIREDSRLFLAEKTTSNKSEVEYIKAIVTKDGVEETHTFQGDKIKQFQADSKSFYVELPNLMGDVKTVEIQLDTKLRGKNLTSVYLGKLNVLPTYHGLKKIKFEQTNLPYFAKRSDVQYYEFGEWPQTLKENSVNVTSERHPRNPDWYKGDDGYYYEPVNDIKTFKGREYKSVNGASLINGQRGYFKVEPIIWERLPGTDILMSSKILASRPYFRLNRPRSNYGRDAGASSNYRASDIRAWLNGEKNYGIGAWWYNGKLIWEDGASIDWTGKGFVNWAFTKDQKNLLQQRYPIINHWAAHSDYRSKDYRINSEYLPTDNSIDKVFLFSKEEVTNPNWGFKYHHSADSHRIKPATDYAVSISKITKTGDTGSGVMTYVQNGYNTGPWWTRSGYHNNHLRVQVVDFDGNADSSRMWLDSNVSHGGVVPGIVLPANLLNNAPQK